MRRRLAGVALCVLVGCNGDPREEVERLTGLSNLPGGNPLNPTEALYPWPSDLYLVEDGTTATGRRLALPIEAVPTDVDPADFAADDGFTRAPHVLALFPEGVDPTSLPDIAGSIAADSPVLLLHGVTHQPVPLLAEVDLHATDPDDQALILRPLVSLEPDTTYVPVLRDGLRAADGGAIAVEDAFRALRDEVLTDSDEVEAMRADFGLVFDAIEGFGVERSEVLLAWRFTTRSESAVVGPVLSMHDQVMAQTLPPWVPISDTWDGANRLIEGEIEVLDFLGPDGRIEVDDSGQAIAYGTRTVPFLVTIPDTVAETRPVFLYGHGFFSDYREPTWGSLQQSMQPWAMSAVSTNFIGFNEDDLFATLALFGGGIGGLAEVADQQLQSHVHFTALSRLVSEQLAGEVAVDRGAGPVLALDGSAVHYMGISNGGTQGSVLAAASPVVNRAALVVPGGGWSHMMQRAVQWGDMGQILAERYPKPEDLQVVLSLTQQLLDPVDILNYAPHLVNDPFEGRVAAEVTLHMAVGDAQVANLVTEWVARSAGIPLVEPSTRPVPLLDTITAPLPSGTTGAALLVYDEGYPALPEGNIAPEVDNGAHGTVRDLQVYTEQVGHFLETGEIVQVCEGPCDPD